MSRLLHGLLQQWVQHRLLVSALLVAGAMWLLAGLAETERPTDLTDPTDLTEEHMQTDEPATGGTVIRQLPSAADLNDEGDSNSANTLHSPARIVLIIDDIGNNLELGRRAVQLPGPLTYAVLPHTPHGQVLADMAHAAGKEVMLHAPMSNLSRQDPGPGQLDSSLDEASFTETLLAALASVPHVRGINNHTGSALTADKQAMNQVMSVLKQQGLYFVDSLTTAKSVAAATATAHGVPNLTRNVFLDNETTAADIDVQFQRLLQIARTEGQAVGIGHPYPQTLDYLETALPRLTETGIELIGVTGLLRQLHVSPAQSSRMLIP